MEEYARPPRSGQPCCHCGARSRIRWQLVETFPRREYEPICPACQTAQAAGFTAAGAIAQAVAIVHFAVREVQR